MRFYWPIAKIDAEQHMVWGYASTEAEDDQGETVTRQALAAALDDYMRFANIREMHQLSAVGVAKEAEIDDRGLYLGAKIVDPAAWAKVVEGVYKGFSIGGRITERDPVDRRVITGLRLSEISVVDRPANPEAVFDCWKRAAAPAPGDGDAAPPAVEFADPGYQPDGRRRYPIDSEAHIRAAWAYIHQPDNARRYTAGQLAQVKARIVDAWRARIDPAGPPAGAANKGVNPAPQPPQIATRLDWPRQRAAGEEAEDMIEPALARLQSIADELLGFVGSLMAGGDDPPPPLAEVSASGLLRKAEQRQIATIADGLAKLAADLVPRLDALQQRVDEIARTPLPPQTVARGFVGLSKREDGGAAETDIVAALARMSEEERTLTLIKAAHANPIRR